MSLETAHKNQHFTALPSTTTAQESTFRLSPKSSPSLSLSSVSSLPKTVQNCVTNFRPQQAYQAVAARMIKEIEISSNQLDENGKEEQNYEEVCNVQLRRESVSDESTAQASASKLNTILENTINPGAAPLLAAISSLGIKIERNEILQAPTVNIIDGSQRSQSTNLDNLNESIQQNTVVDHPLSDQYSENNPIINLSKELDYLTPTNTVVTGTPIEDCTKLEKTSSSPSDSPRRKSALNLPDQLNILSSATKLSVASIIAATSGGRVDEDTFSKSSDTSVELLRFVPSYPDLNLIEKSKSSSRLSERAKKKSWYNVLYPNYKSRTQDFKKLFKDVPNDERLIVDYSCALQREILVQGRLYVSQHYVCFHANIFSWETYLSIKWKDVTAITKEKTALVIPNAISISTSKEKYFFATFTSRDKSFLMLFRVWQNTLMNKPMLSHEIWQWVHECYGDELGLTTDDEDYIDPTSITNDTEGDSDFISAVEESTNLGSLSGTSDYSTAHTSPNLSINFQRASVIPINTTAGISSCQSGNSSASSGGGGGSGLRSSGSSFGRSSKTKLYFFSSSKTNFNSSTASASGSDNKASDNNSRASSKSKNTMKANAKELTLSSAKPDDSFGSGGNGTAKIEPKTIATMALTSFETGSKRKPTKGSRQRDENSIKNSEPLPTDVSDSSDSDQNKIPFVATAECNSTHEGRQILHTILPINIETLFNLLFSKSKFLVDFHDMRKTTDANFGEWQTNEEGQKERVVNLTVQLAASVGPKTSRVTEFQMMRDCSKPAELYSIDVNSVNAGIPYADSFCVLLHYCLVRTVDDNTMLSVHAQIKYKKSIWGVVKGLIEKNTWAGLEDFYTALLHALQNETCIPPAKGKGRRPRRGTSAQVRPMEEICVTQMKAEPAEKIMVNPKHPTMTPHLPVLNQVKQLSDSTNKYKWLSIFVLIVLLFLLVLNVILLFKLWKLEERIEEDLRIRTRLPDMASLKELPNSSQEWIELVRNQEILHETELKKWHTVLQTAIELLKKTEKTLAELIITRK